MNDREKDGERSFSHWFTPQIVAFGWIKLKLGDRSFSQVSHVGTGAQVLGPSSSAFSDAISSELVWEV